MCIRDRITTSLLFGIIHVSLVPFIPLAIFGAVLVLLYEYTGSCLLYTSRCV